VTTGSSKPQETFGGIPKPTLITPAASATPLAAKLAQATQKPLDSRQMNQLRLWKKMHDARLGGKGIDG